MTNRTPFVVGLPRVRKGDALMRVSRAECFGQATLEGAFGSPQVTLAADPGIDRSSVPSSLCLTQKVTSNNADTSVAGRRPWQRSGTADGRTGAIKPAAAQ